MKRGKKSRGLLDTKEPYENNPLVVVREWGALVLIFKACLKRGPLSADLGLVDHVSGYHVDTARDGAGRLVEHANGQFCYYNSSMHIPGQYLLGQTIRDFS